jgi:hypothetical protein
MRAQELVFRLNASPAAGETGSRDRSGSATDRLVTVYHYADLPGA